MLQVVGCLQTGRTQEMESPLQGGEISLYGF